MTLEPTSTISAAGARIRGEALKLAYGKRAVIDGLSVEIPDKRVTVVIGPNACGKSTLLRALSRLIRPEKGHVALDGADIARQPTREVARKLGVLTQGPTAPGGILVSDLVGRGRTPHQSALRQWSREDEAAVTRALELTGMTELALRPVDALSGGQRQRAWIAMALAQETELLLLDEPTTYLDLTHQIELLELIRKLNREAGRTIVMVLHDINLAARYADQLIAMRDGRILRQGAPAEVVTEENMREIFDLDCAVIADPTRGGPLVAPR